MITVKENVSCCCLLSVAFPVKRLIRTRLIFQMEKSGIIENVVPVSTEIKQKLKQQYGQRWYKVFETNAFCERKKKAKFSAFSRWLRCSTTLVHKHKKREKGRDACKSTTNVEVIIRNFYHRWMIIATNKALLWIKHRDNCLLFSHLSPSSSLIIALFFTSSP